MTLNSPPHMKITGYAPPDLQCDLPTFAKSESIWRGVGYKTKALEDPNRLSVPNAQRRRYAKWTPPTNHPCEISMYRLKFSRPSNEHKPAVAILTAEAIESFRFKLKVGKTTRLLDVIDRVEADDSERGHVNVYFKSSVFEKQASTFQGLTLDERRFLRQLCKQLCKIAEIQFVVPLAANPQP